jgi:hypothetical protein
LADGPTSVFGVEQGLSLPPDVLAVAVELVAGDLVDRLALPLGTDALWRRGILQLSECPFLSGWFGG